MTHESPLEIFGTENAFTSRKKIGNIITKKTMKKDKHCHKTLRRSKTQTKTGCVPDGS